MNISKKDVEILLGRVKKTALIFLILCIVFFASAVGLIIAGCLFLKSNNNLAVNLIYYGTMAAALGITFIVLRSAMCTPRIRALNETLKMFEGKETIKVNEVDVRDMPQEQGSVEPQPLPQPDIQTKENELIQEYEKLVEQGIISKEDFEKRKSEILGK